MDIALGVIGTILIIIGLTVGIACEIDKDIIKFIGICMGTGVAIIIWIACAVSSDDGVKVITFHRIEERKNVSFYIDENDCPNKLYDNWQVADPNKYHIRITNTKSRWKYGIYVSNNRSVELVKIDTPEKN